MRLLNDIKFFNYKNINIQESLCQWDCKKWVNIQMNQEKMHYVTPVKASQLIWKKINGEQQNIKNNKKIS